MQCFYSRFYNVILSCVLLYSFIILPIICIDLKSLMFNSYNNVALLTQRLFYSMSDVSIIVNAAITQKYVLIYIFPMFVPAHTLHWRNYWTWVFWTACLCQGLRVTACLLPFYCRYPHVGRHNWPQGQPHSAQHCGIPLGPVKANLSIYPGIWQAAGSLFFFLS